MEEEKINEIAIVNRGKTAYLQMNQIFEERIDKIYRNGKEQYAFIYLATDTVRDLLREFDADNKLKLYNSCFRNIAYEIAKAKTLGE